MDDNAAPAYEARYGFDRRTVAVLLAAVVFTSVLVMPGTGAPPAMRIAEASSSAAAGSSSPRTR